ncbi:MAG: RDD family protein [Wenzhouxiangella sp.]|jgi:uncharacterized RDD family membrane protein YckC|nr:RDD family protein [Wenzhouxiangella sp.]
MTSPLAWRRLAAFCIDWCVIAAWGGLLFTFVMLSGGAFDGPAGPWTGQLLGLATMTVPVVLYFSLAESSVMQASLGKRALGLRVTGGQGGRLGFSSALGRNLVKFAPWEFGHMLAQQAVFSGEAGMPAWTILPAMIAFVGPLLWLIELFRTGRTPYDRLSGSRVLRRR